MGKVPEASAAAGMKYAVSEAINEACKYCAPLFVVDSLTVVGLADLPRADALNGTMTFIHFDGGIYALTADHVVKQLRKKAEETLAGRWLFSTLLGGHGNSLV